MSIRRVIPNLVSADLAASRSFYADVLGFEPAMEDPGFAMYRSPLNPTAQLTLWAADGPRLDVAVRQAQVSVEVEDVDAVHAECVRRGLPVIYPLTDEPWGIRRFFVEDPDGTVLNITMHI